MFAIGVASIGDQGRTCLQYCGGGLGHRGQLVQIVRVITHIVVHDEMAFGIDSSLQVITGSPMERTHTTCLDFRLHA